MKFIKLTRFTEQNDNSPLYINPDMIVAMYPAAGRTSLITVWSKHTHVKETPDEILKLIEETT